MDHHEELFVGEEQDVALANVVVAMPRVGVFNVAAALWTLPHGQFTQPPFNIYKPF